MNDDLAQTLLATMQRIESKLDTLIAALASDDDDEPQYSLDGDLIPGERDEGTPL